MFIILAGTLISLCFFYYMEQKRKARNEQKHEDRKEKFERLLQQVRQTNDDQNQSPGKNGPAEDGQTINR